MTHETREERPLLPAPGLEVTLRYPLSWFSTSAGLDLAPRPLPLDGWRAPGVARFGAWPGGREPQRAATALRLLTLWLLAGDSTVAESKLIAAIRGDDPPGCDDPLELRALWETARRYRATMGPGWCERLGDDFADWLAATRCEARWGLKLQAGGYPSRDELLQVRVRSAGVGVALDVIEYVADCPLPLAIRNHPALEATRRYAARLLAIQSELAGAAEDLACGRPNLLGSLIRGERLRPKAAVVELEALHDESLCGLTGASQLLRAEFPRSEALTRWLREVLALCHGFARWHAQGGLGRVPLPGGAALAIELEYV